MQAPGPAAQGPQFEVISLNMHKGVSALHLRLTAHRLRQRIRDRHPDLVFLQELQQKTHGRLRDLRVGATLGLTPYLAQDFWPDWHYGRNALYDRGHHGNAILSRHPLSQGLNYDISEYRFERRGLLHAVAFIGERAVDCFCVHLGLLEAVGVSLRWCSTALRGLRAPARQLWPVTLMIGVTVLRIRCVRLAFVMCSRLQQARLQKHFLRFGRCCGWIEFMCVA